MSKTLPALVVAVLAMCPSLWGQDQAVKELSRTTNSGNRGGQHPTVLYSVSNDGKYLSQIEESVFQDANGKLTVNHNPKQGFLCAKRQIIRRITDGQIALIIGDSFDVEAEKGPFAVAVSPKDRILYGYPDAPYYLTPETTLYTYFGKPHEILVGVLGPGVKSAYPRHHTIIRRIDIEQQKVLSSNRVHPTVKNSSPPSASFSGRRSPEPVLGLEHNSHRYCLLSSAVALFDGNLIYLNQDVGPAIIDIKVPGSEGPRTVRAIGYNNESLLASYDLGLILWKLPADLSKEKATIQYAVRLPYEQGKQDVYEVQLVGRHHAAVYWRDRRSRASQLDLYDLSKGQDQPLLASHRFNDIFTRTAKVDFISGDSGRYLCFRDPADHKVVVMKIEGSQMKGPWYILNPDTKQEFRDVRKISTARLAPHLVFEAAEKIDADKEAIRLVHVDLAKLTESEPVKPGNVSSFDAFFDPNTSNSPQGSSRRGR